MITIFNEEASHRRSHLKKNHTFQVQVYLRDVRQSSFFILYHDTSLFIIVLIDNNEDHLFVGLQQNFYI